MDNNEKVENIESKNNNSKGLVVIIVVLMLIILGMGIYIAYDKELIFTNADNEEKLDSNKKEETVDEKEDVKS